MRGSSQRAQLAESHPSPECAVGDPTSPRTRGEVQDVTATRVTTWRSHSQHPTSRAAPLSARLSTPQVWGIVLLAPYLLVFLAFVVYPVVLRAVAGAASRELCRALQRSDLRARRGQHADLPRHRHQFQNAGGAVPVRLLRAAAPLDQMAVGAVHPALGGAVDPDHPVGALHVQSGMGRRQHADLQAHRRGRPELAERSRRWR